MATRKNGVLRAEATGLLSRRRSQSPDEVTQADSTESAPIASADKTAIVVISPQVLIRDCLARCLKAENKDYAVLAFASVAEWLETAAEHPSIAVILLCLQDRKQTDVQIEYELSLLTSRSSSSPTPKTWIMSSPVWSVAPAVTFRLASLSMSPSARCISWRRAALLRPRPA